MKPLTKQEIKFIKETSWTPTVQQADEWSRTIFANDLPIKAAHMAYKVAKDKYNVDLDDLYTKCIADYDSITLENDAVYLLYTFFTKEELEKLTDEEATKWLKDFKYHCGYRKWDDGNLQYVQDAISVYKGNSFFYLDKDNEIWWFDEEPANSECWKKYRSE